jgi:hypothetical protein
VIRSLAADSYTIDTVYNPGPDFTASSDNTHAFTIAPAAAALQLTGIAVVPNLFALNQTETIHAHALGPGGVVNQGTVAFKVDGQTVSAAVDGSGNAMASLTLPLLTAASSQSITAVFNGPNRLPANAAQTALLGLVDALLPDVDTSTAAGGQSVQSYLMGLPLLDFFYPPQGQLTQVIFGPSLLSWNYSYFGGLTVVTLDGVLPVAVMARTPQGQLLGAVQLTVSAGGTPVVELINAQGQVVFSQPV